MKKILSDSFKVRFPLHILLIYSISVSICIIAMIFQADKIYNTQVKNCVEIPLETVANRIKEHVKDITNTTEFITKFALNNNLVDDKDALLKLDSMNFIQDIIDFSNNIKIVTILLENGKGQNISYQGLYYIKKSNSLLKKHINISDINNISLEYWYNIAKEKKTPVWSEPYTVSNLYDRDCKIATYTIPLFEFDSLLKTQKFIGAISVSIDLSFFKNILEYYNIGNYGYSILTSAKGNVFVHPISSFEFNKTININKEDGIINNPNTLSKLLIDNSIKSKFINILTNTEPFAVYNILPANNWTIYAVFPQNIYSEQLLELYTITLFIMLLMGAGIFFFTRLSVNAISEPLSLLDQHIKLLIQSNGTAYTEISNIKSKYSEINNIVSSFKNMEVAMNVIKSELVNKGIEINILENDSKKYLKQAEIDIKEKTNILVKKCEAVENTMQDMKIVYDIGMLIISSLKLEEHIKNIFDRIQYLVPIDIIAIFVVDNKREFLTCRYAIENRKVINPFSISINENERLASICYNTKKTILIHNFDAEIHNYAQNSGTPKTEFNYKTSSVFYVPLIDGDNVIGVFTLQDFHKNTFINFSNDTLSNLKDYVNIAVKNIINYDTLINSYQELKEAQKKMMHYDKMASLGQLTAGIAHEIKNPLNFVINFSELSSAIVLELSDEMEQIKEKLNDEQKDIISELLSDLELNVEKINEHSKRADSIIRGMLQHSRGRSGEFMITDLNTLVTEYSKLAYHGLRASDPVFNVKVTYKLDETLEKINIVPHNISRVILNIVNNACFAAYEKTKIVKDDFTPEVTISTKNNQDSVLIIVKDNGIGISEENMPKLFNPFFTTKTTGQGTGLGLSMSYDIITEEHKGEIKVDSVENEYAQFTVTIPKNL